MRQGFDQSPGGVAQQLGIGIQRDDKPNALELCAIARAEKSFQLGRGFADEESIELLELAALAFPADPALLALAPRASAMKKKEAPRSVPAIQFLYSSSGDVYILCVLRHALPRRVRKIGQERKAQIRIRISEVTNFEAIEFVLDRVRGGQQHRHHYQRAAIIGNAFFFKGHFGQDLRRQERGREIIHGQYRQLTRRQEQQKSQQSVCQPMNRSGTE